CFLVSIGPKNPGRSQPLALYFAVNQKPISRRRARSIWTVSESNWPLHVSLRLKRIPSLIHAISNKDPSEHSTCSRFPAVRLASVLRTDSNALAERVHSRSR